MTIAQIVTEILQRSDEAFIGVSEERARRMFYLGMTEALREGAASDTDIKWFVVRLSRVMGATNIVTLANLESELTNSDTIINVRSIYCPPENAETSATSLITVEQATKEDIRKWGLVELQQRYTLKWYQVGDSFHFHPVETAKNQTFIFEVIRNPRPYGTGVNEWGAAFQMNTVMTLAMQNRLIEAAAQLLRQEVAAHEG